MQITILGGGGFLGQKLARRLATDAALDGRPITGLTLFDLQAPARPNAPSRSGPSAAMWPIRRRWRPPSRPAPMSWCIWRRWSRPRRRRISTSGCG
ncbi:hypothetical protein ACFQU2_38880 [Siccirubricoccus deserti]